MPLNLSSFIESRKKSGKVVPARLQAALALLERLRDVPSLSLDEHRSQGSAGVKSHETYGDRAHDRFNLQRINKNHGRRSSNLSEWGQELLDLIAAAGFKKAENTEREMIINAAQAAFVEPLRKIIEQEPLEARTKNRSAEAVVHELLLQAEEKGKSGDVAQYLVGAKLTLRFKREFPVHPANKSDRKSMFDPDKKMGDFVIENAIIEVAVGLPDDKHLDQIIEILDTSDSEVWLLTRDDRVSTWKTEVSTAVSEAKRVIVTSVEAFVGQNITELAVFSSKEKAVQLSELFKIYNALWVERVGTPGIRIVMK